MTMKDFVEDLLINGSKQMVDVESAVMDGSRIRGSMKHPAEDLPLELLWGHTQRVKQLKFEFK